MIVFPLLMCMPCILIVITFPMSMLSFIEDNKRNEHKNSSKVARGPRRRMTWRAADVAHGTASRCDAALRPRGRARVARAGGT